MTRALSLLAAAALLAAPATAENSAVPRAAAVVSRGHTDLARALGVAVRPAMANGAARPVAFVVDVTENTRARRATIAAALEALEPQAAGGFSIARLGERLRDDVETARALVPALEAVLAGDTPVVSTLAALRKTVRSAPRDAVVVYLADWRFEDEAGLERLVDGLEARDRTLSVVGSEAAFGRAWNDGIRDRFGRIDPQTGERTPYVPGIGRDPFGARDHDAPWHGGDSAYPAVPYRFAHGWWQSEFSPHEIEDARTGDGAESLRERLKEGLGTGEDPFEDLRKRLPGFAGKDAGDLRAAFRRAPLPSAFGPYALMHACGRTGGRYVLWSWNPAGRPTARYDFGRCDLFGPDLRERDAIHRDVRRRPLARAMVEAWHALLEMDGELVAITAPLKANARTPRAIELLEPSGAFTFSWPDRQAWRDFVRVAGYAVEALDEAAETLDAALAEPGDEANRRTEADARLFRHLVRVLRFEVNEALHVAEGMPKAAWDDEDTHPGIAPRPWIEAGLDPDRLRTTGLTLADPEAGEAVHAARARLLRRYRGTPFAYQVGLNAVHGFAPTRMRRLDPGDLLRSGRSPSESSGDVPETPAPRGPASGSGGAGPATGGGR